VRKVLAITLGSALLVLGLGGVFEGILVGDLFDFPTNIPNLVAILVFLSLGGRCVFGGLASDDSERSP